jgi:two-component system chemotaxis response regulator CheB
MSPIRVVVVDDSALCRDILRATLEVDGDIRVVGEAANGQEAVEVVARGQANIVTLDVEMPHVGGLTAVERIMARTPVPILIVTGRPADQRNALAFEAVRRGALDLIAKPTTPKESHEMRTLVRRLAAVAVVRHVAGRSTTSLGDSQPVERGILSRKATSVSVVGIAASAGGPGAVTAVLSRLPRNFGASIAVVQHMLPGFAPSFVRFLRMYTALPVQLVGEPTTLRPGTVFVAADEQDLVAGSGGIFATAPQRNIGHRPSADALFHSLARTHGSAAVGVVLSGIGSDGAAGLLAMRDAGALTIAQNEQTSAVYGMPRAARENGAATRILALEEIGDALMAAVHGSAGAAQPRA